MNTLHVSLFCLGLLPGSLGAQTIPVRKREPLPRPGDVRTAAAPLAAPDSPFDPQSAPMPVSEPDAAGASVNTVSKVDHSIVYYDAGADGALWSRAANYKLRMDSSGTTFVPFFGSRAPQDYPLHVALAGATLGGEPLEIESDAAPVRTDDVVRFERGAIDEVYEIAPAQLEQEFVIDSLPAAGELVLRVALETELNASTAHDGFDFANEFGTVHCGGATAVDARGRRLALESELVGDAINIRVPASFIADAVYPLVIDPVWFTLDLENGATITLFPDAAHPVGPYLFVCWEEVYSVADHDVVGKLIDGNGYVYSAFYIDSTFANWVRPRAGHLTAGDRVLVAAEVGALGSRSVQGRTVQVAQPYSPSMSSQFEISESSAQGEKFHPEVGGDPYPSTPSYFCVVYERAFVPSDHDILARLVDGDGVLGNTIWLENSFSTLDTDPAISKTDDGAVWNIAWQRLVGTGNHDVLGARVSWSGAISSSTFAVATSPNDERYPTVSGPIRGTNRYMVAFENQLTTNYYPYIDATLIDGTSVLHRDTLDASTDDGREPALEGNGRHFVCVWGHYANNDIFANEIQPIGDSFQIGETAIIEVTSTDWIEHAPRLVCHEDSDKVNFSNLYFALWNRGNDIAMAAYLGLDGGSMENFCQQNVGGGAPCPCGFANGSGGCPNSAHPTGATLNGSGAASTVADGVTFEFADLPPNVSCLMFQGPGATAFQFGDGRRCIGTPTIRFPIRAANGAGATGYGAAHGDSPISVVGGVPIFGGTYCYQVWYRDPAAFCTPATTNLTNAVRVIWTP